MAIDERMNRFILSLLPSPIVQSAIRIEHPKGNVKQSVPKPQRQYRLPLLPLSLERAKRVGGEKDKGFKYG